MSKRSIGLILVLSLVMVMAFASIATAAQLKAPGVDKDFYLPTPKNFSTTDDAYAYPNGIYLPNDETPASYRIHTNYSKNTDACAACHATHTAVGESLLQWSNVYEACMACHDGTVTTTYDVKGGFIGAAVDNVRTFGGMFGAGNEASLSNHNVAGAVDIASAPGGTTVANANEYDPKHTDQKAWETEFGCASCHNPHGQGGNARILNPNPNQQMFELYNDGTTTDVAGDIYNADNKKYTFDTDASGATGTKYLWIKGGYPYSALTAVYDDTTLLTAGTDYTINNKNGDYTILELTNAPAGTVTAWFVPVLKVKMTVGNYLQNSETVTHKSGLNAFCGACHTDYNTEAISNSGEVLSGEYSEAYRHKVGKNIKSYKSKLDAVNMKYEEVAADNQNFTCETCHFAHGTSKGLWDAVSPVPAEIGGVTWGDEIAGSSALKRLPNMGTCETCHTKADGNEGYSPSVTATAGTFAASSQAGATFVGSNKCKDCHKTHVDGVATTQHTKMLLAATADNRMPSQAEYDDWLADNGAAADFVINDGSSTPATFANAKYVIGSKRKQRFIFQTGTDEDPNYRFANYEYYKNGTGSHGVWNSYGNSKNYEDFCMACHTTGLTVDANGYYTGVKELGVNCESCHGAGSNHASAPGTANITNPAKLNQAQSTDVCGSCHNRGYSSKFTGASGKAKAKTVTGQVYFDGIAAVAGTTQREDAPTFKPGDDLADYMVLYKAVEDGTTGSSNFYKISEGAYASGHHQQYMEFVDSSKHYRNEGMTCATCHSSHGKNKDGVQLKVPSSQVCGQCHGNTYDVATYMPGKAKQAGTGGLLPAHTFIVPGSTDQDWLDTLETEIVIEP